MSYSSFHQMHRIARMINSLQNCKEYQGTRVTNYTDSQVVNNVSIYELGKSFIVGAIN